MAKSRLELHDKLLNVIGNKNVYFQPPESFKMSYPCIRYSFLKMDPSHANNHIYKNMKCYQVIVISNNPDWNLPDLILDKFQYCKLSRQYLSGNLYHFVFEIYY